MKALAVDKNPDLVDEYFDSGVIRHNPFAQSDGTAELKAAITDGFFKDASYQYYRVFAEGDLVVIHGEYTGLFGPGVKTVGFDLFRLAGGKIVEHWDCLQTDPGSYVSGHTMVDGPTVPDEAIATEASRKLLLDPSAGFYPVVILGGAFSKFGDYVGAYVQHNPLVGDGLEGFLAAGSKAPINTVKLLSVHKSVAQSDFVFVRTRGTMTWEEQKADSPDNPAVFCDLFRVKDGKLEEHWDVIQLDPISSDINDIQKNGAGHTMWE